jgi:glycosyltransferase involved in cell wall biosynthesis
MSSSELKISIVIPCYNQGQYIEQTILSILNQSHKNIELIVIDGGSTDETIGIIQKFSAQLKYWVSEKDNGQAHAINKGLEHVTGDIFNWINSDDFLEEGALASIADFFEKNTASKICCGYTRCFFDEDNSTSHVYKMGLKPSVEDTMLQVEMNQPGSFYRTSVVKEFNGVCEGLRYVFDDELWFRFLAKYGLNSVGFLEQRVAQFRLHKSSKSVGEGFPLFEKEINGLYFYIAKAINTPDYLLRKIENEPKTIYEPNFDWDFKCLNPERFVGFYAAKYVNTLYIEGQHKFAKKALQLAIKQGYFKWNRPMLSLYIKLFFT